MWQAAGYSGKVRDKQNGSLKTKRKRGEAVKIKIVKRHNLDRRIDLLRDGLQGALVGHTLPATKTSLGNFRIRVAKAIDALRKIDPVNADCWRRFHRQAYAIHPKHIVLNKKDCDVVN